MTWRILQGDCIERVLELDEGSVEAVVCDPPYGLELMGKDWDRNLNHGPWATEALRVLKPGGHLLAFGGTRTYHRLTCAIEDAGFEIRDSLIWLYGSGFPKSLNVSKAMDKRRGVPATPEAQRWQGWGTAAKPAHEPIVVARKPLIGNVAQNVTATPAVPAGFSTWRRRAAQSGTRALVGLRPSGPIETPHTPTTSPALVQHHAPTSIQRSSPSTSCAGWFDL
ncbi:MAG: DNA methyltransferase [Thermoanaerobaculia bacterium]